MQIDPKYRTPLIVGGVAVAVAALALVLTLVVFGGDDDDDDDSASPDASPSASASVSPTESPSVTESATPGASAEASPSPAETTTPTAPADEAIAWSVQAPEALPPSTVVYIEKGCWQCDGPTEGIERVAVMGTPGSEPTARPLFDAPGGDQYISSSYVSPRGNEMWITVCSAGDCGPLGSPSDDAETTISQSLDGGITWSEVESLDGAVAVVGVSAGIPIMARYEGEEATYFALEDGNEIAAPEEGAIPVFLSNSEELAWHSADNKRLLRGDGEVIFESAAAFGVNGQHPTEDVFLIVLDGTRHALVEGGEVVEEYDGLPYVSVGAWTDSRTATGNADLSQVDIPGVSDKPNGLVPVRIDFATGAVTPLEVYGPLNVDNYGGRNRVRGLDQGIEEATTPYLVVAPDDCLNVRDTPSTSAAVVACWNDGVILWVPGTEPVEAEGITWIPVVGPDTSRGWGSSEFLQP